MLRSVCDHTPHDRTVVKNEGSFEMPLNHCKVPCAARNVANNGRLPAGSLAGQSAHIHRVPTSDAAAIEREPMWSSRVDLVEHVFVVASRMRADAMRFSNPSPQRASALLPR